MKAKANAEERGQARAEVDANDENRGQRSCVVQERDGDGPLTEAKVKR